MNNSMMARACMKERRAYNIFTLKLFYKQLKLSETIFGPYVKHIAPMWSFMDLCGPSCRIRNFNPRSGFWTFMKVQNVNLLRVQIVVLCKDQNVNLLRVHE